MQKNANFKNLTSQIFGYLKVVSIDEERTTSNRTYWKCVCVCGKTRSFQTCQLTSGRVTSCGCKNPRTQRLITLTQKRIYTIYNSMLARCNNPKSISYKYYGAKGITVCNEWENSFKAFVEWSVSNGYNDTLSIDRIDNSKGYCPSNCRWIPLCEQAQNKTTTVKYTHNGETHNLKEWCNILNFNYVLAKSRRKEAKRKNIEPTFEYVFAPPKFKKTIG